MGVTDVQRCMDAFPRLTAPRFAVLEEMSDAVAANPGGIGFTSLSLRRNTRPLQLGTECGTGIEANSFRIKTDEYPLGRRLYMYTTPGRAPNQATREFLSFILSPEGQVAVAAAGFADLAVGRATEAYGGERLDAVRDAQDGGRVRIRPADTRAFEEATAARELFTLSDSLADQPLRDPARAVGAAGDGGAEVDDDGGVGAPVDVARGGLLDARPRDGRADPAAGRVEPEHRLAGPVGVAAGSQLRLQADGGGRGRGCGRGRGGAGRAPGQGAGQAGAHG